MSPLLASLLALALAGLVLWAIRPYRFRHIGWVAALPPGAVSAWLFTQLPAVSTGNYLSFHLPWSTQLGLELALRLDGLALFFALIIAVIGTVIALYTGYYFEDEPRLGYFYGLLFLFMASMLGIVLADNLLTIYVFWEGTSITSYLLIAFKDSDEDAQNGARRAFLITGLGGLAMLFGMVLLGNNAGTYTISEIIATPGLMETPGASLALVCILLGAFTKSAQFPFHFWLPGAMSAPTPASAYLHSATMVKAGVFLLARLHPALSDHPIWFWGLLLVGGTTMVVGAFFALGQYDLKALLAYATVSQLGVFVMLLAFSDEAAFTAVIVGILAHALYKGPLFMSAGIIDHATGTRDLRRLANLRRQLPLLTAFMLIAGLSMAGVPPMFGYLAKELMLENFLHISESTAAIGWTGVIISAVAAAFTVAASFTMIWEALLRPQADVQAEDYPEAHAEDQNAPNNEHGAAQVHHAPALSFVLPPLILVLIGLAIPFLLPQVEAFLFDPPITSVAGTTIHVHLALWHGFTPTLMVSLIVLLVGTLLFYMRAPLRNLINAWPAWLSGVRLWEGAIRALYQLAIWITRQVQGTTLLQQARGILLSAILVMGFSLAAARFPADFPIDWATRPELAEIIIAVLAIFAAVTTVNAPSRLGAIISIGVVGIAITLFFVFYSAPDLALTQLLVDILTVVLLVLVFYRIPPKRSQVMTAKIGKISVLISALVGLLGFFLVLVTVSQPIFPTIGDYFLLNSVDLGHGGNVVNVILVDFRGFDTFGEITVLAIAAIGGYSVLRAALFRKNVPTLISEPEIANKNIRDEISDGTANGVQG